MASVRKREFTNHDWVEDYDSLIEFISYLLLSAPSDFPEEDFLKPEEQMNLDKAHAVLKNSMEYAVPRMKDKSALPELMRMIEETFAAYRKGDEDRGAHLLQSFEKRLLQETKAGKK